MKIVGLRNNSATWIDAGGSDAVMILGITNRLTYDIWAKPEIKRPEDLKSKTLAISANTKLRRLGYRFMIPPYSTIRRACRSFLAYTIGWRLRNGTRSSLRLLCRRIQDAGEHCALLPLLARRKRGVLRLPSAR